MLTQKPALTAPQKQVNETPRHVQILSKTHLNNSKDKAGDFVTFPTFYSLNQSKKRITDHLARHARPKPTQKPQHL